MTMLKQLDLDFNQEHDDRTFELLVGSVTGFREHWEKALESEFQLLKHFLKPLSFKPQFGALMEELLIEFPLSNILKLGFPIREFDGIGSDLEMFNKIQDFTGKDHSDLISDYHASM